MGDEPMGSQSIDSPVHSRLGAAAVRVLPPLVGRREELDWLERCLRDATAGRPQLVLIPGEPGIGKTRLVRAVQAMAKPGRAVVCTGRGYEDLALPYLTFIETLEPLLEKIPDDLAQALGKDLETVRQLSSRVRGDAPDTPRAAADSGESTARNERLRLLLAASHVVIRLAQHEPMLLVIDDLQWADQSSIDLLLHLVYAVSEAADRGRVPLMIACTYRPAATDSTLAATLARIRREAISSTIELSGLDEAEVIELIRSLGVSRPPGWLVSTVNETARGNPLFIQELVHHLVSRGALTGSGGLQDGSALPADLQLPEDVTTAIAGRTRDLSRPCRDVLALAACLGNRFSLRTLTDVTDVGESDLLKLIEEGLAQGVLVAEGQALEFAHPLIRHALYGEGSGLRRQQLHLQIAQALRRVHAANLDEHLLPIAHHLVSAGALAEPEEVAEHALRAADQAAALCAYGDAARYYRATLEAAAQLEHLSAQERADLHYRAGLAHYRDTDANACLEQYDQAIRWYEEAGDARGLAQTHMERVRVDITKVAVRYGTLPDLEGLEAALQALGDDDKSLRGRIYATRSEVYWHARQPERALAQARQALEIGQSIGDEWLCSEACQALALAQTQTLQIRDTVASRRQAFEHGRACGDRWLQGYALHGLTLALFWLGDLQEAESVARRAREITVRTHAWGGHSLALAAQVGMRVVQGEFVAAEELARETLLMAERSGYPWGGYNAFPALACGRYLQGLWTEADKALGALDEPGRLWEEPGPLMRRIAWIYRQLIQVQSGLSPESQDEMISVLARFTPDDTPEIGALSGVCAVVEIADLLELPELVEGPYRVLSFARERGVHFSSAWPFLIPRVLGVAASLRGSWADAESHYRAALEAASRVGAQAELGRCELDYARMLTARSAAGDSERAHEHLIHAMTTFAKLGMRPFIRRAEALAAELEGSGDVEAPAGPGDSPLQPMIVLMTDMARSTELIQRLGDREAREVMHTHNRIVRACLRESGAAELQHTGDGFLASHTSATQAVACAIAIQQAVATHNRETDQPRMLVRVALTAGEPLPEEGRLFGAAVNAAARLCSHARPGEILVLDVVRQLAAGTANEFIDRGQLTLKGFEEPFHLHEVRW